MTDITKEIENIKFRLECNCTKCGNKFIDLEDGMRFSAYETGGA